MKEVKRMLKPGGCFILLEMHRNAQMDAQSTSIHLHHWAAEVDCMFGRFHNKTLRRQELINHATKLSLQNLEINDVIDVETNPHNSEMIEYLQGVVDEIIQRAKKTEHSQELIKQGEQLHIRLKQEGALPEPKLLIVGKK
jgi:ubiquinone/menaquinone biosynthesis C-methylase UbiE